MYHIFVRHPLGHIRQPVFDSSVCTRLFEGISEGSYPFSCADYVGGGSHVGYRCGLEQTIGKSYLCPCSVWTLLKVSRYFSLYLQASQVQYWLELRWKMASLEVMVLLRVPSVYASISATQKMNYMSARGAGEDRSCGHCFSEQGTIPELTGATIIPRTTQ